MANIDEGAGEPARQKRADARRNEQALLDAAAMFVMSGVEAPVHDDGATAFCRLRSYLATLRKQGLHLWQGLASLLAGPMLMPTFS